MLILVLVVAEEYGATLGACIAYYFEIRYAHTCTCSWFWRMVWSFAWSMHFRHFLNKIYPCLYVFLLLKNGMELRSEHAFLTIFK